MLNKFTAFIVLFALWSVSCRHNPAPIVSMQAQMVDLDQNWPSDSAMDSLTAPYADSLAYMLTPLRIYNPQDMHSDYRTPALYNWFAGAVSEYVETVHKQKTDLAVFNAMSLRRNFPQGHPNEYLFREINPFDNKLVVLTLSGSALSELFDQLASKANQERIEAVYGLYFELQNGKWKNVRIGGMPLDKEKKYRVLTIDYLQKGANGMPFFSAGEDEKQLGVTVVDAMLWYADTRDTLRMNNQSYYTIKE